MNTVLLFKAACTVLVNASLAWMSGVLFARICLGNCAIGWCDRALHRLHFSVPVALGICIVASFCALWAETAVMNDSTVWDARGVFGTMLTMTHYGRAGLCGLVMLMGVGFADLARNKSPDRRVYGCVIATFLLVFAFSRVSVSHAAINRTFGLDVWAQWLHLLLIGLWTGAVMVSGWMVLPCAEVVQKPQWRATSGFLIALSRAATMALAGIAATGAYNAYRGLGTLDKLSGNTYGHVLTIKLCVVAVAVGLGAFNRFIGFPAVVKADLSDSQAMALAAAMQRVVFILRLESLVLLGVLIAAAVLTGEAPPALS